MIIIISTGLAISRNSKLNQNNIIEEIFVSLA